MRYVNPFEIEGRWFKGNLHTHTTRSDGHQSPEERAATYRLRGYDFLAITDHDVVVETASLSRPEFVVLQGAEYHPANPRGGEPFHLLCLNVPSGFEPTNRQEAQAVVDEVVAAGGLVVVAHPYWAGQTVQDVAALKGPIGLEVYNATCTRMGKPLSAVHWDDCLDRGMRLVGIASDDCHRGDIDLFQGWVMVKAEALTPSAIYEAIRSGAFYSTRGPQILDVRCEENRIAVRCSPVHSVAFVANACHGRAVFGEDLTEAEFEVNANHKYVRIECTDAAGRTAWTNPVFVR